ncbi:uncharacterized protein BXZ73DRAFT_81129 [Epithele typhae]|uniref:uncharacterized protein n=1 Tax=Epithele typhae TaxID=378194 RepID=UPI0020082A2E|nr:uncharacterized protein BXZ73DRAFT_81129 [Epithele typhae]KAH9916262.1 hypothetical protein BXZ73DRAFT_81129 [Epithele typhae]
MHAKLFAYFSLALGAPHLSPLRLLTWPDLDAAIVSLFIPDVDPASEPIPISGSVLGVDSLGRTTWRLQASPTPSGKYTAAVASTNTAPVTLVEGPNEAHIMAEDGLITDDCVIKDGKVECTLIVSASGSVSTFGVSTQTLALFDGSGLTLVN